MRMNKVRRIKTKKYNLFQSPRSIGEELCAFFMQVMLIFLQNMNLLLQKTPQNDIKNHVLPMVYRALEANTLQIQVLCSSG